MSDIALPVLVYDADDDVTIEAVRNGDDGSTRWAVRRGRSCLNRDLVWEYEPMPSYRDEAFFARCRYASAQDALDALIKMRGAKP